MKIPVGEIPEAEIDEFGNEIVKPNIAAEYVMDGVKIQELSNFDEYAAYTKQLERNRDQSMLDDGRIEEKEWHAEWVRFFQSKDCSCRRSKH